MLELRKESTAMHHKDDDSWETWITRVKEVNSKSRGT